MWTACPQWWEIPRWSDGPKNVREADVVASARGAGAVIWGKTNVPLMAGDMQTLQFGLWHDEQSL